MDCVMSPDASAVVDESKLSVWPLSKTTWTALTGPMLDALAALELELVEPSVAAGANIDANAMTLMLRCTGPTTWFDMMLSQIAFGSGRTLVCDRSRTTSVVLSTA